MRPRFVNNNLIVIVATSDEPVEADAAERNKCSVLFGFESSINCYTTLCSEKKTSIS